MAQPTEYVPQTTFLAEELHTPRFPGTEIDTELQLIKQTTDELRDNLESIQRDDGALANESVDFDQLTDEVRATLGDFDEGIVADAVAAADVAEAAADAAEASATAAAAAAAAAVSSAIADLGSGANTWDTTQTFTEAPVFIDQSGSRTALGLGTAAVKNTGTSGNTVPLLDGTNTWSATQIINAAVGIGGTPTGDQALRLESSGNSIALMHRAEGTTAPNVTYIQALGGLANDPNIGFQLFAPTGAGSEFWRVIFTNSSNATVADCITIDRLGNVATGKSYEPTGDGVANVVNRGADKTGVASSSAAVVSAYGAADTIYFPPGTYKLGTTASWPAGRTYVFARGAILMPDSGVDITIQGSVVIDHWEQCFDLSNGGGCSIVGIKHVRHEWWGATGDGTTNDQPACQAAHDCTEAAAASEGGRHVIEIRSGKVYALSSTLQWRPTKTFVLHVEGGGGSDGGGGLEGAGGCVFKTKASFTGTIGLHVAGNADGLAGYRFGELQVYNQTSGSGPSIGLKIGTDRNNRLESNRQNFIEAIRVSGFSVNAMITNTRVLRVDRFSVAPYDSVGTEVASGTGLLITVDGDGTTYANTSDLDFGDFQLEGAYGSSSPSGIGAQITSTIDNTAVAGIRFHRIVAYGCEQQVKIAASGGASVGDIWFPAGCQFEGPVRGSVATRAIVLIASGSGAIGGPSEVGDIHIDHTYMSGNGFQKTIEATVASTGVIRTIYITNNNMPSSSLETIILNGSGGTVYDVHIHNNSLRGVATAAGTAISLANITNANCNDNTLADCSGLTNFILWSGASNHFVSHGNSAGGCATNSVANTATGSPTFSVANNI